ncbi:MAG: hypothetical protein LBP76_09895 [Treponema sp.]|jgi:hypothetical protein|nr:hypothetical protein [Treponema sp.]
MEGPQARDGFENIKLLEPRVFPLIELTLSASSKAWHGLCITICMEYGGVFIRNTPHGAVSRENLPIFACDTVK